MLLYQIRTWTIGLALFGFALLVCEIGFHVGSNEANFLDETARSNSNTVQAALLGLLSLLLGFSFAMAASRYDSRKALVVEEANALGTAYLRCELLPDPARTEACQLLRSYLDTRLRRYQSREGSAAEREADRHAAQLQRQLWSHTAAIAQSQPSSVTYALTLQSLNEVIDLSSKHAVAMKNHVPEIILWLLLGMVLIAMFWVGLNAGVAGRRSFLAAVALALALVSTVVVIIDLDRPQRGAIRVDADSMDELAHALDAVRE